MSLLRCFSSLGCPDFSLDETLALATKHGIGAVELRSLGGTVDLPAYFAEKFGTPENLATQVRASGVRVVGFNTSLHLTGSTREQSDQLVALAPWAEALGVSWLRVFDGKDSDGAGLAEALETLRWWRGVRAAHGWAVDVSIETHDALFSAAAINRFLAAAPGSAILWDAHHTWRKSREDPAVTWRAIRAGVVHVHVKDSIEVPSAKHPYTYVLPGSGAFPITSVLAALRTDQFAGPVSLEWEKLWHPYLPSLDEALTVAAQKAWW